MANSNWDDMPDSLQKRLLSEFAKSFEAQHVLSNLTFMRMERKKVGKWEALWLKITFRKPPMVYVLPKSTSDTITFKRPHAYTKPLYMFGESTVENEGFTAAAHPSDLEPDQ